MKRISFIKMNGAGNDFIVIDNYRKNIHLTPAQTAKLCRRRYSIGADGLMMLERPDKPEYDFYMKYFNADGSEAEMCGNGGRCISRFAYLVGRAGEEMHFLAKDGPHYAEVKDDYNVKLEMTDPDDVRPKVSLKVKGKTVKGGFINTGVPHFVTGVRDIEKADVEGMGAAIRKHKSFGKKGANVNFVQKKGKNSFAIRTFERGVEGETLACGTGATAAAILMYLSGETKKPVTMRARGGVLKVHFRETDSAITKVLLEGEAKVVSAGYIHEEAFD